MQFLINICGLSILPPGLPSPQWLTLIDKTFIRHDLVLYNEEVDDADKTHLYLSNHKRLLVVTSPTGTKYARVQAFPKVIRLS